MRRLARPLLAAPFIAAGADATLHPLPQAESARPLVQRLAPALKLPSDPELFVRANGAVMVGAGTLLALGRLPRLSSLVLAVTVLPGIWADHAFWQEKDPQERRHRRTALLREAGMLGGALLALVDTEGRPGLARRGRRAVQGAGRPAVQEAVQEAEKVSRRDSR